MLVPRWSGTRDLDRKIAVETRRIWKRNWKLIKQRAIRFYLECIEIR